MQAAKRKFGGYWIFVSIIITVLLVTYAVAEALKVPPLTDTSALNTTSWLTAFLAIGLLTADALLPVPSSVVMVTNGALFGFVVGSLVSLIGMALGFSLAYWLGRRGSPLVQKALLPGEIERGNRVLQKWGVLALILTRPLPILAETTSIMAGVARLSFGRSLAAIVVGSLPGSVLYAWAGANARGFNATVFIFMGLVVLGGIVWWVDRRVRPGRNKY